MKAQSVEKKKNIHRNAEGQTELLLQSVLRDIVTVFYLKAEQREALCAKNQTMASKHRCYLLQSGGSILLNAPTFLEQIRMY